MRRIQALLLACVGLPLLSAPSRPEVPSDSETGSLSGTFLSLERLKTRGTTSQRDVVVYLVPDTPWEQEGTPREAEVTQRKLRFEPHVLPVLQGARVVFKNEDEVTHNVFAEADCCSMDLDMAAGEDRSVVLDEPGIVPVICRLHPDMALFVVVLEEPWFTHVELDKVKEDGESLYTAPFRIDGVPPGSYTLTFWNKKLKSEEYAVTIEAGKETVFDITVED